MPNGAAHMSKTCRSPDTRKYSRSGENSGGGGGVRSPSDIGSGVISTHAGAGGGATAGSDSSVVTRPCESNVSGASPGGDCLGAGRFRGSVRGSLLRGSSSRVVRAPTFSPKDG